MPANDLSLSIHSPVLIYSFLAAYGLLTILMLIYVRAKFRSAAKTLNLLQAEWQSARSTHESFVGAAHEQLSKLIAPKPASNSNNKKVAAGMTPLQPNPKTQPGFPGYLVNPDSFW